MFKSVLVLFALLLISSPLFGSVPMETLEVALGNVFIPEWGYGTNNDVQLTLDGYLPNSCYQLGQAKIERDPGSRRIIVHQYADRDTEGVCADLEHLPAHLANLVPYTYDVSLGHLAAGPYRVIFNEISGEPRSRIFHVYRSRNPSADDLPYAAISTVSMPDVVNGAYPFTVELLGSFTSTCSYLSELKVTRQNDVIVVQPVLGYRQGAFCSQVLVPFRKAFQVGNLSEGRYLIHVRSMSGRSVSHAFSVLRPDPTM